MKNTFGHSFVLVNKVRQMLPSPPFIGGPWMHLATVIRGLKEYCAFVDTTTNTLYIEEVDPTDPNLFKKISDDKEWADLYRYLMDQGCITTEKDKEFLVGGPNLKDVI